MNFIGKKRRDTGRVMRSEFGKQRFDDLAGIA
jgi:hypothetical protein